MLGFARDCVSYLAASSITDFAEHVVVSATSCLPRMTAAITVLTFKHLYQVYIED